MTSIELAKSIYEKANKANKTAWLSDKQNSYLFSLLEKEGRLNEKNTTHTIATVLPNGDWVNDLTHGEAIEIAKKYNVDCLDFKQVKIVRPPFYIRREGFKAQKIIIC